jgi:hypothetical protein
MRVHPFGSQGGASDLAIIKGRAGGRKAEVGGPAALEGLTPAAAVFRCGFQAFFAIHRRETG